MKKTACAARTPWSILLIFFSNTTRSICHFLLLHILIKDVGVAPKIFEAYICTYILTRVMKLSIKALQQYDLLSYGFGSYPGKSGHGPANILTLLTSLI